MAPSHLTVFVCDGPTCGHERGADALCDRLRSRAASDASFAQTVRVERETCFGHCVRGPNVLLAVDWPPEVAPPLIGTPGTAFYNHVAVDELETIVDRHRAGGLRVGWRR